MVHILNWPNLRWGWDKRGRVQDVFFEQKSLKYIKSSCVILCRSDCCTVTGLLSEVLKNATYIQRTYNSRVLFEFTKREVGPPRYMFMQMTP